MPELPKSRPSAATCSRCSAAASSPPSVWPPAPRVVRRPRRPIRSPRGSGRRIEAISRRGKYLLFRLSGGLCLVAHLRMTGALLHRPTGDPADPYVRAVLAAGRCHRAALQPTCASLASSGWWPDLAVGAARAGAARRRLHAARLRADAAAKGARQGRAHGPARPGRPRQHLRRRGALRCRHASPAAREHPVGSGNERLHRAIRRVLDEPWATAAPAFATTSTPRAARGRHHLRVKVFRRTGQPCYVCGAEIARVKVGGPEHPLLPPLPAGERSQRR